MENPPLPRADLLSVAKQVVFVLRQSEGYSVWSTNPWTGTGEEEGAGLSLRQGNCGAIRCLMDLSLMTDGAARGTAESPWWHRAGGDRTSPSPADPQFLPSAWSNLSHFRGKL